MNADSGIIANEPPSFIFANVAPPCLLDDLPAEAIEELYSYFRPMSFSAGEVVTRRGRPAKNIYFIVSGKARIWAPDPNAPATLEAPGPGQHFAECTVFGAEVYQQTVSALTHLEVLACSYSDYQELAGRFPQFMKNLGKSLTRKLDVVQRPNRSKNRRRGVYSIGIVCSDPAARHLVDATIRKLSQFGRNVVTLEARELGQSESCIGVTNSQPIDVSDLGLNIATAANAGKSVAVITQCRYTARQVIAQCDQVLFFVNSHRPNSWGHQILATTSCEKRTVAVSMVTQPESVQTLQCHPSIRRVNIRMGKYTPGEPLPRSEREGMERVVRAIQGKRIGLALGGGGARGMAHIGALEVFEQHGIVFDSVAGTSAGAIVGAAYARGLQMQDVANLFRTEFMPPKWLAKSTVGRRAFLLHAFRGSRLENIFQKHIGRLRFDQLELPLAITTVDLVGGEQLTFDQGDVVDAVLSSINHPVFGRPIIRDGKALVDGGVLMNVPAAVLAAQGCDRIISIDVGSQLSDGFPTDRAPSRLRTLNYLATMMRTIDVTQKHVTSMHRQASDLVIQPATQDFRLEDFHAVDPLVAMGRLAAKQCIGKIRKSLNEIGVFV